MKSLSFQQIIFALQHYWEDYGCAILQSYDIEVGAGTFHPATVLRSLTSESWNVAYTQASRRPMDSRYGLHSNRMQQYYQFQVILKPSPNNMEELYLNSLKYLGINMQKNDIRFIEDDWESPTLGSAGLGWEIWCNGMEISQFTYMQQIGGVVCRPIVGELTYGLERIALHIQGVHHINDLDWNGQKGKKSLTYAQVSLESEKQFSKFNLELADTEILFRHFIDAEIQCNLLIKESLPIPAYDYCIKASHIFNLLCSRGLLSVTERESYVSRVRNLVKTSCETWIQIQESV